MCPRVCLFVLEAAVPQGHGPQQAPTHLGRARSTHSKLEEQAAVPVRGLL